MSHQIIRTGPPSKVANHPWIPSVKLSLALTSVKGGKTGLGKNAGGLSNPDPLNQIPDKDSLMNLSIFTVSLSNSPEELPSISVTNCHRNACIHQDCSVII